VIVQDKESSVIWGMPGVVQRAGLAESMLSLNDLGNEIVKRVRNSQRWHCERSKR